MTMDLFNQFATPHALGIPLILVAMLIPALTITPTNRLLRNRVKTLQAWATMKFTKHLMSPLNTPGHAWAMPLMLVGYFILINNTLGLLPYTFTPTTQLALNAAMAVPLWLTTVLIGLRTQTAPSLAHMLPTGTPLLLIPALIIIETISLFIRPLALAVRLTANLTAGHLLITLISTATMALSSTLPAVSILLTTLLVLLTGLEIAVAAIQAYVFVLLLSLYLQENT
uniref:ATP synthase subunit a n=1 Tax=Homonota fasciata TaxID=401549 RepID=A0A1Y1CF61_9SAUR|nr:ATPase subunit 6 [Homonota fasciata]